MRNIDCAVCSRVAPESEIGRPLKVNCNRPEQPQDDQPPHHLRVRFQQTKATQVEKSAEDYPIFSGLWNFSIPKQFLMLRLLY